MNVVPDRRQTEDQDIAKETWDPLGWSQLPAPEALKRLQGYVLAAASDAENWYQGHKRLLARWSRFSRAAAIIFAALGGLAPIIAGLRLTSVTPEIANLISQLGFFFIGVAAAIVAFDRYFGLSAGWLRYVTAMVSIQRLRSEFVLEWCEALLTAPEPFTRRDILPFLEHARKFRLAVLNVVAQETDIWTSEFRTSFADLESMVRAERGRNSRTGETAADAAVKQGGNSRSRP